MTFATVTNVATMILCIAVLIQAVRLMRALDTVKGGALTDVVRALEISTGEARNVLNKLSDLLRGDVAVTARTLNEGKSMIEELTVMTGIANAIAERIVEAAGSSNRTNAVAGQATTPSIAPRKRRAPRVQTEAASAFPGDDGDRSAGPRPTPHVRAASAAAG
ncbi:MAG: hypothetical protein H7316_05725 [Tardiphaga sp.]|uniref:hypothetical protein n=1 Tax=Tardiphaga sp. TaxID=1926292 RepID=UPI001986F15D|nr:hypothetical protein [Tardiphaga sp.]MBC7583231.1 hypothetical protein [Tardiphaga sp.]